MKKILSIIGTRPEAIKMAPVIKQLEQHPNCFTSIVCVTGQHREMLDQIMTIFDIKPDYNLDLMTKNQTLANLTSILISKLDVIVRGCAPDYILAQGDTTTVMASALVAYYNRTQFGHIEAGLRTMKITSPFPEEANRRIADVLTNHYFAPTLRAQENLLSENIEKGKIHVTGNTVIDALHHASKKPYEWSNGPLKDIPHSRKLILVTVHRRESFGAGLQQICSAIQDISAQLIGEDYHIVFPVHLNPNVQEPVYSMLSAQPNISLLSPLDYLSMINLLKETFIVLTDSGGIQEEAPSFGIPVLVMRDETERPEGVELGVVKLVGSNKEDIVLEALNLITNEKTYTQMARPCNPYGDGESAKRIISILKNDL